jgi:hypothetical protein
MRPRRPIALLVLLVLVAACSSPAVSVPPSSPASSAASPSASDSASASPGAAAVEFTWPDGEEPAVSRELAGLGQSYINPGAVIDDDGTLHMYANVFTAWPGRVQIAHLTSTDGATWEAAADEAVMTSDDVPFADPGHDVSAGFVTDDGTWVLVLMSVNTGAPWEIGLATGPGPDGPWTVQPEPVLTAGEEGSIDAAGLEWPSVVPTDDGWAMYYTARAERVGGGVIAMATSADGLTWTKVADPVLTAEAEWEGIGLDRPRVALTDDGYVMVYSGGMLTDRGIATSEDGVTWTRIGDGPVITQDTFPVAGNAWDAALIHRDGELTYYLEIGFASAAGTEIYRATAPAP